MRPMGGSDVVLPRQWDGGRRRDATIRGGGAHASDAADASRRPSNGFGLRRRRRSATAPPQYRTDGQLKGVGRFRPTVT